jgi:hypothetical protein
MYQRGVYYTDIKVLIAFLEYLRIFPVSPASLRLP